MVASVTGRGGRGQPARSHMLVKTVGGTISASWDVTNTGGGAALGWVEIAFPGQKTVFRGPEIQIPAGATMALTVSGVIALAPGSYRAQVRIRAMTPATVLGGNHRFILQVGSLGGGDG